MSQPNLGDKVRSLYNCVKDIKRVLATCTDMSNKPLSQYDEIILQNLGGNGGQSGFVKSEIQILTISGVLNDFTIETTVSDVINSELDEQEVE